MASKYKITKIQAKSVSYGSVRSRKAVKHIVIHYTGNNGDTARGNGLYFKNTNTRQAGAHFFVDRQGKIVKSVNMNRVAWSVGGFFTKSGGAGTYYGKCTNANSVSIELCDIASKDPSKEQIAAVKWLIKYIRKYCPNATKMIRHWDVNGKSCPARMASKNNERWADFKAKVK